MPDNDTFHSGGQNRFDGFCKQYGKYAFFVNKWWDASPDFMEIQEKDFRVQEFLHRMDSPTREAYLMDGRLFACLPRKSRIVYALYYGDGISLPELAEMFRTTTEKIEKMANTIRRILRTEELHLRMLHNFVKHELRIAHHSYVGSLKLAMHLFPDHPNVKALKDSGVNLADKFPVFGESLSAQLPHAVGGVAETVKAEVQQVSQVVETVANGHVATGAGTLAAAGTVKSFSAILMALAMPFLWIMSVLLCGKILGTALVREAPSINIRRWLTKHLFISCCLGFSFPFTIILMGTLCEYVFKLHPDSYIPIIGVINSIYFFGSIAYLVWMNRKYWRLRNTKLFSFDMPPSSFESIEKFIKQGIKWLSIITWFVCIALIFRLVWSYCIHTNSGNINSGVNVIIVAIIFTAGIGIILKSITLLFDYLLMISKNEESAKEAPTPLDSVKGSRKLDIIRELVHIGPFAAVSLIPNVIHLCRIQTRPVVASIELVLYALMWLIVLQINTQKPNNRWYFILGTFALQIVIFVVVKSIMYGV